MKHVGLILVLLLLGCGPKKISVTPPAAATDTLTIVYVGNLQDYLLSDSTLWPSTFGETPATTSIVIARFEPLPGLTAEWYGRLGLEQFLNEVYSGALITAEEFLAADAGRHPFSAMKPAGGSMIRNFDFGRVGFVTVPDSDATDSVYFEYRRNRSIMRARSEIMIALSEGPDLVSDTAVNFSLAGGRRVGAVIVVDRTVKKLEAGASEPMSRSVEDHAQKELASFRARLEALRAETLFIYGSNKASNHAEFKKFIAGQIRAFFAAGMTAIPTSVFRTELGRGRRAFTIDSVAAYLNGSIRFGVQGVDEQEAKALVKDKNLFVTGKPEAATTVACAVSDGIQLYDVISRIARRR